MKGSDNMKVVYKIDFEVEQEAKSYLDAISDIIHRYGLVSLADIFDLLGHEARYYDIRVTWFTMDDFSIMMSTKNQKTTWSVIAEYVRD